MDFLKNLTAFLPLGKKEEKLEYFFAINIGTEKLTAALWTIAGKELKILGIAPEEYSSSDEIISVADKVLDQAVGLKEIEPQKILFGVPDAWVYGDNLKDEYLGVLRRLVKELELAPMAYVAASHALVHFLEKQEGIPATAILVGFDKNHLTVTVVRAGKIDGVKAVKREDSVGLDIEKALLSFTEVETLPSKILIYGWEAAELKDQLLSFAWMSKLSFLHFPKIDVLDEDIGIKSVCLAGASEIHEGIIYKDQQIEKEAKKKVTLDDKEEFDLSLHKGSESAPKNFGFVVGDVVKETQKEKEIMSEFETEPAIAEQTPLEIEDFEQDLIPSSQPPKPEIKRRFNFKSLTAIAIVNSAIVVLVVAYILLSQAVVKIYVEPKLLEKDAQVIADPEQKTVDEEGQIIPGQAVEAEVSGSAKDTASGKKQIGDPAKGIIIIYNKTFEHKSLSKGTQIINSAMKFTLDTSVTIASQSASDSGIAFGKANTTVTASVIGADGNLPSGSDFTITGYSADKLAAKSEGNFSGGTSKEVTVVSSEDQQRLLASLAADLRKQAQQKLQEKYPNKKILEEALSENIIRKNYSKNINDQASEVSLNMTVKFKGTAFDDADLKTIVSKLVNTQVPDGFLLDLSETESQADIAELKKDGKLVFLAKFKAKLMPKIDTDRIKSQIKFKTPKQVTNILKGTDHILDSEIKITPNLPSILSRLPILTKNIKIEVDLK